MLLKVGLEKLRFTYSLCYHGPIFVPVASSSDISTELLIRISINSEIEKIVIHFSIGMSIS